ncbi:MAG: hypothetical protein OEW77_02760 [Gemmatimonadota bacterium]|nr:hypothetical protein [Gemmatimonadota bacterium]
MHIHLRDGDIVEGGIYLTDGQALAPYLASRKNGWVNIVNAVWLREGELHNHAVLQTDHVVIASSSHRDFPVISTTQSGVPRPVDVLLEDGTRIQGNLFLGHKQRLSDYLAGCGSFLALLDASRVQDGDSLGDIAVNAGCVKAVRDAKVFSPKGTVAPGRARDAWGGLMRTPRHSVEVPGPSHLQRVKHLSGEIDVVTPTYPNDRRSSAIPYATPVEPTPVPAAPPEPDLTDEDRKRAERIAHHWLVQLAADAQLNPPDARDLSDDCTLEEIWHSISFRNDMAEGELAIVVASSYRLELANLDHVSPEAVRLLPEKVALRLNALPLTMDDKVLTVAVSDPESLEIEQQLGFATKLALRFVVATPADIAGAIEWHHKELAARR